jgi:hypothetical protein
MSVTFEPREVEKPFRMRWVRMTLQLMLRAPVRFGIAILLLGCLDAFVLNLLPGAIPTPWTRRLGMFLLPLAWVVTVALARGADDSTQNWKALSSLARPIVWMSALAIGLGLVTLDIAIERLLFPDTDWQDVKLVSGRALKFTCLQAWLVMQASGICFFPLLVLETGLSFPEVRQLSLSATEINGRQTISWFMTGVLCGVLCVAQVIETFVSTYGLTMAAGIVFMGVLNYVAYRDIFERRSENSPKVVATGSAVAAVHITNQCAFEGY